MSKYKVEMNLDIEADGEEQAIDHLMDYLADVVRNDDATGFSIEEDGKKTESSSAFPITCAVNSVIWIEFYNLAKKDEQGITFPAKGISICGCIFRIEIGDHWYWIPYTKDQDFKVLGNTWTDFGVACKPFESFRIVDSLAAAATLEQQ